MEATRKRPARTLPPSLAKAEALLRDARRVTKGRIGLPARDMTRRLEHVHVVPHTHWDREWWMSFEGYRAKLVPLLDGLIDMLETHPEFASFTFDGQVAPIDDYLAALPDDVRPRQEARLKALVSAGRIFIGPWYTLSDQFLVSGETTLRNLEMGMARAKELGGSLDIAYCPDQFGLIQDLPKILAQVGITKVIGERGMRRSLPDHFFWESKDGSRVEVVNLKDGYFQSHPTTRALVALARRSKGRAALFLAGYDHAVPSLEVVRNARKAGVTMSSLPAFWKDLSRETPATVIRGELRDAGDKDILPNVISNRSDQRLDVATAERRLERYAEPLSVFTPVRYPDTLLSECWKNQILNAAHDSACASGIDDVALQVRARAHSVRDTANGIIETALSGFGETLHTAGQYVWNPSNFARDVWFRRGPVWFVARDVPPLGWKRLRTALSAPTAAPFTGQAPYMYCTDQGEAGDTYTTDPKGPEVRTDIPVTLSTAPGESFSRVGVKWFNQETQHRVRLHIKLPDLAASVAADTPFGSIVRPTVPEFIQGRDRLNGFPASKFIVAGGLAILVDRAAEYEYLPGTNEIAITLTRSHGALSVLNPKYRFGPAGPRIPTRDTQMLGDQEWHLAVLPWKGRNDLPWKEWESFMLPMERFASTGGGILPESGTAFSNIPGGVLSAVTPTGIRSFEAGGAQRIVTTPLALALPGRTLEG